MIGPSDIRIAFSQIPAAEHVQSVQQQHPDISQRQFALYLKEQQARRQSEVQDAEKTETERAEKAKIPEKKAKDRRSEDQSRDQSGLNENEEDENKQEEHSPGQGKFIDIRI